MFHTFLKKLCVIEWIRNVPHQHNYPSTCKEDYGGITISYQEKLKSLVKKYLKKVINTYDLTATLKLFDRIA